MKLKIRILVGFLLIFLAAELFSQGGYLPDQLNVFVSVYMTQKENVVDTEKKIKTLLIEHEISQERYAQMVRQASSGKEIIVTVKEKAFFEALDLEKAIMEREKEAFIQQKCADENLDYEDYLVIFSRYQTDIRFQRSLKPYFDQYFKRKE